MPKLTPTVAREIAEQLSRTSGRAQSRLKREYMQTYSISASTLSRALTAVGFRSHERSDRGRRRVGVTDEQLMQTAALQRKSLSLRKGVVMPAEDAIEIAVDSGLIEPGVLKPDTYNRYLRGQRSSRREQQRQEPHVELKSLGPNHVHQFDFSLAVNWKIFQGKPTYEHLVYKNKPPMVGEPRLWRAIVSDHATGVFFPWYGLSTGETVQATLEALYRGWARKDEAVERVYPFRGVLHTLMLDRGPANRSQVTVQLLERLGVNLNICEGARSKGQVERAHGFWEEHFESRLRLQPPESVEQLNEWALDFTIKLCACRTHTRTRAPHSELWAWHIGRRPETELRELTCDFEIFKAIALTEPKRCFVYGNRTIKFQSREYRLPEAFAPGDTVLAQFSPFSFPKVQVRAADTVGAAAWTCQPIERDELGFSEDAAVIGEQYRSHKKSETARFVDEASAVNASSSGARISSPSTTSRTKRASTRRSSATK